MTIEGLITTFGYPALAAGVVMEGETVLLIAGYLAHNGHFLLPVVMLIAWGGAFAADVTWFFVGRHKGGAFIAARPRWHARADRVRHLLVRYHTIAILGYRFIYGMRTVTPLVIGASGFPPLRFVLLNLCSTLIWGVSVAAAGYYFGGAVGILLADAKRFELLVVAAIVVVSGWVWLRRRRHSPPPPR